MGDVDLLVGGVRARFLPPPGALNAVTATVAALLVGIGGAAGAGRLGWQASTTMPSAPAAATAQVAFGGPAQAPVTDPGDPIDQDWSGMRTSPGDEGNTGPQPAPGAIHLRHRTATRDPVAVLAGARRPDGRRRMAHRRALRRRRVLGLEGRPGRAGHGTARRPHPGRWRLLERRRPGVASW